MTGWEWCKAVLDPKLVGYYRVDGQKVTFTTKKGKRHVLAVADWVDVEHGKKLVAAALAGKVPPVAVVALPTLDDVMVDAPVEEIEPSEPKVDADELDKHLDELVEEANKPTVHPKKPKAKKAIQTQEVDLQSL